MVRINVITYFGGTKKASHNQLFGHFGGCHFIRMRNCKKNKIRHFKSSGLSTFQTIWQPFKCVHDAICNLKRWHRYVKDKGHYILILLFFSIWFMAASLDKRDFFLNIYDRPIPSLSYLQRLLSCFVHISFSRDLITLSMTVTEQVKPINRLGIQEVIKFFLNGYKRTTS